MSDRSGKTAFSLVLISLTLYGCANTIPGTLPTSALPSAPTEVPVDNPSLVSTTVVTQTTLPISTVTLTPLPTIAKTESSTKLDELYDTNNDCRLPCWWGITPGVTTWGEALHFLNQFSEFSEIESEFQYPLTNNPPSFTHYILRFPSPYPYPYLGGTRVDFEVQKGTVVAIRLWEDIGGRMFSLNKLYTDYGLPERILIVPQKCTDEINLCEARMYFLYDSQRFVSEHLVLGDKNASTALLCVSEYNYGYISTWSPDVTIDIGFHESREPIFIPIEQATNLTIDEFFLQYRNTSKEHDVCFDVPLDLWK